MAAPKTRRWDQKVHLLINLVKENYELLTGALSNAKTKPMIDARWDDIVCAINSLGYGSAFSNEKSEKKDLI